MLRTLVTKTLKRIGRDDAGITAVEYAVLGGLIAAALVVVFAAFEPALKTAFTNILAP
ncbi:MULTISPECIES: Flp family type IVb pilin [Inquilinus]|uniref:Pilus assembly protein Flp/PilA n=1 Tax=Inquilinus ginsengisoli TaxID=363840 RepID=A0ABU1K2T3_9PROT|nr:Flp family type IVb pilin [Inquilinus ginsengisoli]MDR6294584.1 pilus assembly protein Flp/PilA [Inquilinus ginsengisoli]